MSAQFTENKIAITISKIISNFFNPVVSLFINFVVFNLHHERDATPSRFWSLLLILILPSVIWIFWNVKKGRYTNMDVSNREQRKSLYIVLVVLFLIYLGFEYIQDRYIDYQILFLLVLIIIMQISNLYIKSSMHTAINIFVAFLFLTFDVRWAIVWFILSAIIGITRIILKRHTLAEVISGAVLGSLVGLAYYFVI